MFIAPPPLPAIVNTDSTSLLERFLTERVIPSSDPDLQEAFRRLWEGSTSFREVASALYREQPKIRLQLRKIDSESFGDITLSLDPQNYRLDLAVQWRGVRRGLDLPEPWLASLLFALREVSRSDGVVPAKGNEYTFSRQVKRLMWNFQAEIRRELRAHDPVRYRPLAASGEHLYWDVFPPKPRLNRD